LAQTSDPEIASSAATLIAGEEAESDIDSRLRAHGMKDFVVVNPGGGWPTKKWESARYGRLTARIQRELGVDVIITTGPGEEMLYQEVAGECKDPVPPNFAIPFLHLIPLLRRARLMVGGDTGPFHLACALGTPVVGIFGPTSPERNGPWPEPGDVVAHVLPCSYCYGRTCPTNNECMDISVEEVFATVVRRLERTG
jgi:ADP-heptose:LPS heptosyltransferase